MLQELLQQAGPWIYLVIAIGPYIQEDAALVTAAGLSLQPGANVPAIFLAILVGLFCSDYWKYWIGRWGRTHKKAEAIAGNKRITEAGRLVTKRLAVTVMAAKFIPGTRVPTYVAAGFFKAHHGKFSLVLFLSGLIYVSAAFGLFHMLGEVAGEAASKWVPIAVIGLVVTILLVQLARHKLRVKEV